MKKCYLMLPVLFLLFSCNEEKTDYQLVGSALGTTYNIQYSGEGSENYQKQLDSIFAAVNQSMSTYHKNSDISRINKGATDVVVDEMFQEVYRISKKVFEVSEGAFDPTVGQLVNAYGFGAEKFEKNIDSALVDSLMRFVGFDQVQLTPQGIVEKRTPELYLEFNAVAKGYCIDRIGLFLDQQGITNYLIELGGELLSKGKNQVKDKDWVVGIDDPTNIKERTLTATMLLKDRAMATSGNYRKFRVDEATGTKYVHSIDPRSGFPKMSQVLSTSVLAKSCAVADAYATAFMVLELEDTKMILEQHPELDVYILYTDVDGEIEIFSTQGFEDVIL